MSSFEGDLVQFISGIGLVSGIAADRNLETTRSVLGLQLVAVDSETHEQTVHTFSFPHAPGDYAEIADSLQAMIDAIRSM